MGIRLGVVLALPLLLVGCGTGSNHGPTTVGRSVPDLDGTSWIATTMTQSGQPHALVAGSELRVDFSDGNISVMAGCNHLSGSYTLSDEAELSADNLTGTTMGCDQALTDQDGWVSETVFARPLVASVDGETLRLSRDGLELVLTDRDVASPDVLLVGTSWQLEGIRSGDSVSSLPAGTTTPTFSLAADGTVTLQTGCNGGQSSANVSGSTITFGPVTVTKKACADRAGRQTETAVLTVLSGAVEWSISEKTLTFTKGDHGLVYRAAS